MKRRIKVLHVILSLDYGGTEKIVLDIVNGLSRDEFESSVICMDRYGERASDVKKDVTLYLMDRKQGIKLQNYFSFLKILKTVKPDIVHFRNFTTYFWGCMISKLQKKCKIVYSDHSEIILNYETNEKGKLFLRKLFKHITDNFMTNSLTFKEKLVEYVNLNPDDIVVIPNGVSTERFFSLSLVEKRKLRIQFGFGDHDYLIGIVAGLAPKKNIPLAIEAMSEIKHKHSYAKLILVGGGEMEDELKILTKRLGLSDKVLFLGIIKGINKVLNIFDMFLLPSSSGEGMPNAVLEAMAAKVPVIASDIPGNIELLHDGERGVLFKNNNKNSLVDTVLRLANDKELSNQIVERAYQYVKDDMSVHRMIERYENFYRAVYKGQKHIIGL
jgi:glycosyltransferase involved in cell wall biosynthesis